MRWLALCIPDFALQLALRACSDATPVLALSHQGRLLAVSPAARQLGLTPGLSDSTALALAPQLQRLDYNPLAERHALEALAAWALQFTPRLSLRLPNQAHASATTAGLVLDIAQSLRLFGGLPALAARIREGLTRTGCTARLAFAPTATAAWLMACHRDGLQACQGEALPLRLSRLPVALLDGAVPHQDDLLSLGVHCIGDLLQLPRAGVARRFGTALLDELDQALGHMPEHWPCFESPARFNAELNLLASVEHIEALGFAAQRLIEPLCGWLIARQAGARGFELTLRHERQPCTTLTISLSSPAQQAERLAALLREHLLRLKLSAPVSGLALSCDAIEPLRLQSHELFAGGQNASDDMARLVERLQARLGADTISRLHRVAEHRPEYAHHLEPLNDWPPALAGKRRSSRRASSSAATPDPAPTSGLPRPLWLLAQPIPIQERGHRPFWQGPLALLAGPERIEAGWWDGGLVERDYFIAENGSHRLLWIYRERATHNPADTGSRSGWFVQGYFG